MRFRTNPSLPGEEAALIFVLRIGTAVVGQDKKGELAAGKAKVVRQNMARVTATVEAVDLNNWVVVPKGAKGNTFELKVGDQVEITYAEVLAISVEKAEKK